MTVTHEQATWFADAFQKLVANVDKAIVGKDHVIRLVLTALISDGHVLLEDPDVVIQGDGVLHLRFPVRRGR